MSETSKYHMQHSYWSPIPGSGESEHKHISGEEAHHTEARGWPAVAAEKAGEVWDNACFCPWRPTCSAFHLPSLGLVLKYCWPPSTVPWVPGLRTIRWGRGFQTTGFDQSIQWVMISILKRQRERERIEQETSIEQNKRKGLKSWKCLTSLPIIRIFIFKAFFSGV